MSTAWDSAYAGAPPPWDIGRPQPVVVRIAEAGGFQGRVLDAGCGTGENALYLASRGLEVVGADWSRRAIAKATAKAAQRGLAPEFLVADALDLGSLGRSFDSAVDSGLFHTFDDDDRVRYVASLASVLRTGAVIHLLCFSDRESWGGGPRRVSQKEIRNSFAAGWHVKDIEPFRFEARIPGSGGAQAWHATIERAADAADSKLRADQVP